MSQSSWYTIRRHTAIAAAALAVAVGGAPVAAAGPSAEIWIYADIGESLWEETVSAKTLCREIAALDASRITVRLNSYGGSVSDGIAIHNALRNHPAHVTTCVDGIAASIASLIAQAGNVRQIAENGQVMVHAPWIYAKGNAPELRAVADMLDGMATVMAQTYANATGRSPEVVQAEWLDGTNHWFTAAEAIAAGLADETVSTLPVSASLTRFDWAPAAHMQTLPPAAAAAQPTGATMPQAQNQAAPNTPATPADAQAAADAAVRAEITRQADIRAAFKVYAKADMPGAADLLEACLKDPKVTLADAKAKLLEANAKGTEPLAGHHVVTIEDERDKTRAGVRAALEMRGGLAKHDTANPFRGFTLGELARHCLAQAGVRDIPGDKLSMVAQAFTHSSSDFPLLLANVAQKAMMKGYDEADETFQLWTTPGSLPDFKVQRTVDIGSFPALRQVGEGGEYKYITVGERGESRMLATYGERFTISRQAIINDDLEAFTRIPRKMGRAAIRTVGNLAYAVLTGNPNMADGVALFHASHNNLQGAAVPSTASVDAMRVAMARQKDVGQTTGSLNIRMKSLIVPVSLEGAARVVRDSQVEVLGTATKNNTVPNSVAGTFDVISDARLDDASTSVYYGAADPAMHDTVVVDYLDGQQTPTLEQQAGWSVDGTEFKVRIDASAKALDWKTLQRNG